MRALGPRSQLILFVAAVLVPCAVLIALSIRIVDQDRELQVKRRADERHQVAVRARDALLAALEAIRTGEITSDLEPGQSYRYPETVFVAWMEQSRLVLPWDPDRDQTVHRARSLIARQPFDGALRACTPAAAACYERAAAVAENPQQSFYARWLQAEALDATGQAGRAEALFRAVLDAPPQVTDPDGIPLRLHAALSILQRGGSDPRIVPDLQADLSARPWMPPLSSFVVTEIAGKLSGAPEVRRRTDALVRLQQQAESLQNDFPRLQETWKGRARPGWVAYGEEIWLLGTAAAQEGSTPVIAVRGRDLFARMAPPGTTFADSREPGGESLGDAIVGVKLLMPPNSPTSETGNLPRRLFYLALVLAVSVTMFAAWLLWRDLQREVRLSELRAQFVASVSHELKTPLTAIRMFAETLQMGRCTDPDTQSEYLGTIVNESERLSRLVDGVLLFAKSEHDKKIWHFRTVQPLDAVRAAVRALEYPLSEQGFQLHLDVEEHLPPITADRDALEQAALNLLSNAMKFSGDSREIRLALTRQNGEVVLAVTDFGIGIAPEEQGRVFEKFYRVRTPETGSIPGAGLGLALVSQIMKAHGGSAAVSSTPGKGSTFTLRFPIQPARQEEYS